MDEGEKVVKKNVPPPGGRNHGRRGPIDTWDCTEDEKDVARWHLARIQRAGIEAGRRTKKENIAILERLEDELMQETMTIVRDAMRFKEIDASDENIPQEWIDEVGLDGAKERMRVAAAAWLPSKEAPAGMKMAAQVMVGMLNSKKNEGADAKELNVAVQVVNAPARDYEVIKVIDS